MDLTNKKSDVRIWLAAVLLFFISYPIWIWPFGDKLWAILIFLFYIVSIKYVKTSNNSGSLVFAYIVQIYILYITFIFGAKNINLNGIINFMLFVLGFSTLFLCEKTYWKSVVDKFIIILAVMLVPTLIEHILLLLNISIPYSIGDCDHNPETGYYIYSFNAYKMEFLTRLRFYAFYDEPGVLGNIVFVLLYIQKFDLKKWYNIILIISGVLSFSLAFYIALVAYYFLVSSLRNRILFLFSVIVLFFVFNDNPLLNDLVVSRLQFEDGQLSGYNRTNRDFENWFNYLTVKDYIFAYQGPVEYEASWRFAMVKWGIIPCLLYLFSIFLSSVQAKLSFNNIILVAIILIIVTIQRPFFAWYHYVFLLTVPPLYFSAVKGQEF